MPHMIQSLHHQSSFMIRFFWVSLLALLAHPIQAQQAVNLRVMHYNLLQYGNPCGNVQLSSKDVWLESVLSHYQPDLFTVNEMAPNAVYAQRILARSVKYTSSMQHGRLTNRANASLVNMIFYHSEKLGYADDEVIDNPVRDINVYKLYVKDATRPGDTTWLYCIVGHFKAGNLDSDDNQRDFAANSIMDWIDANIKDENILVMGDFNISSHTEPAFRSMVFNEDAVLRLRDPSGAQNGWGSAQRMLLTQSTRNNSSDCGSSGGMDDRFDFILTSRSIMDGTKGITYTPGTYTAYGNDGSVFNNTLDCNQNSVVPDLVCANLRQMSDHLPVVMEVSVSTTVDRTRELPSVQLTFTNPFREQLTIRFAGQQPTERWTLEIRDLQGRSLYVHALSSSSESHSIRPALAQGVYWMRLREAGGASLIRKIVRL